jgi:hypothetical protein
MNGDQDNDGASAPGVAFAYETAKWQIEKQEQSLREVNARLAFLIAGLLGLSTYYFKELRADKDTIANTDFRLRYRDPSFACRHRIYSPRLRQTAVPSGSCCRSTKGSWCHEGDADRHYVESV